MGDFKEPYPGWTWDVDQRIRDMEYESEPVDPKSLKMILGCGCLVFLLVVVIPLILVGVNLK